MGECAPFNHAACFVICPLAYRTSSRSTSPIQYGPWVARESAQMTPGCRCGMYGKVLHYCGAIYEIEWK